MEQTRKFIVDLWRLTSIFTFYKDRALPLKNVLGKMKLFLFVCLLRSRIVLQPNIDRRHHQLWSKVQCTLKCVAFLWATTTHRNFMSQQQFVIVDKRGLSRCGKYHLMGLGLHWLHKCRQIWHYDCPSSCLMGFIQKIGLENTSTASDFPEMS